MSITVDGSTNTIVGSTGTASISGVTNILSGATANFTDFPRAQVVVSTANTGVTDPGIHALVCEAKSDGTYNAHGLDGCAATNGTGAGIGISGTGRVTATGDTGGAFGVYSSADATHAGGINYGVYSSASNGATNYSFYGAAGTLYNTGAIVATTTGKVGTTLGVGNATPAASGAGITFPATQSASSDANTLDDYEEGTWIPVLNFNTVSTGITYSAQSGSYTKIGRMVYVTASCTLTSKGVATGAAMVSGLPFADASGSDGVFIGNANMAGMPAATYAALSGVDTYLRTPSATGFTALTDANITDTSVFRFSAVYYI